METKHLSSYLEYLPAYLQSDPFLGRFLLAFEQGLSGIPALEPVPFRPHILTPDSESPVGLETIISQIHTYLDPQQTPADFLPWLAGWVALSLREDWDEAVKRQFISQIVPLYRLRGTIPGLKKMLTIYLENSGLSYPERTISVFEFADRPHYFQVQLALPSNQVIQPDRYWRECRAAQAIINEEKPAHTFYALRILTLTMQLTQTWGCCYPFAMFEAPLGQRVQVEVSVELDPTMFEPALAEQILIRIQGKTEVLEPNGSQMGPVVRQTVFYEKMLANPNGYFVALANLSDRRLSGTMTVQLNFTLNHQHVSVVLLTAPFRLEPNLRIYRPWRPVEEMSGTSRLTDDPQTTLRLQSASPPRLHQAQTHYIDGNTHLRTRRDQTMRLVHDARLRIYKPRTRWDQMQGSTRLGSSPDQTMQLPRDPENLTLQVYTRRAEYKIGNTLLGSAIGDTLRIVPNSQWLERIYRFHLFDPPDKRRIEIEALIEPQSISPEELPKISHLLVVRMQSQTAPFPPYTPELEFVDQGIRVTHHMPYERFLKNIQGFYIVIQNLNNRTVTGTVTIRINFNLNQRPTSLVVLVENFELSPRVNALEICHQNTDGTMGGNTILGRVTPAMLRANIQEDDWID
ncbi:phage tail protein [Pseudanabaena sp. UWO310]|uniref:phage tail protein n=1 Tax=Pseudanabaena sp. UWO310 TaxID=2480795 RepID=UPI0011574F64|nr:phage tail protein [Pseudanabaena sp. UWO310]TYQ30985.1 phage tail protein [Pseudanabaena sp. UWO310]